MKLKNHLACSALAVTATIAGCANDTTRAREAPLTAATPSECPVCTPTTFTVTLPMPSPSPTPSPTPEPSPSPTASPTPDPTASPTPDPTVSPTPFPTISPTPDPTLSPTPYATATPIAREASAQLTYPEFAETLDLAAALSPDGAACLDAGGTLSQGEITETSSSVSADFTCDCGGAP